MTDNEAKQILRMVATDGIKPTAKQMGIQPGLLQMKIRKLEKRLGFSLFPPYDYGRMTYQGRMYLNQ